MGKLKHSLRSYFKTPIFSLEKNFICFSGNLYRKKTIYFTLNINFWLLLCYLLFELMYTYVNTCKLQAHFTLSRYKVYPEIHNIYFCIGLNFIRQNCYLVTSFVNSCYFGFKMYIPTFLQIINRTLRIN